MGIGEFIDGPLWYFSATVFLVGVAWHLVAMLRRGIRADYSVARGPASAAAFRTLVTRFWPRREIRRRNRTQVIAGYVFHLSLFALLFVGLPHVDFYQERIFGFGWWAMPDWAFVVVSEISLAALMVLWLHRAMEPVTRLLSNKGDHFAAILIFVVMLTGCAALDRNSEALRLTHFLFAEVLLIYFPFSALMHAVLFVPSRLFTGAWFGRRGIPA